MFSKMTSWALIAVFGVLILSESAIGRHLQQEVDEDLENGDTNEPKYMMRRAPAPEPNPFEFGGFKGFDNLKDKMKGFGKVGKEGFNKAFDKVGDKFSKIKDQISGF